MKKYAAFYLVVKDEFCLEESCASLKEQGVDKFLFCVPQNYWSGRPVPPSDVDEVERIGKRYDAEILRYVNTRADGVVIGRASVEAQIRNHCLAHLNGNGYDHVLIVDADEIWKKDSLSKLDECIEEQIILCATVKSTSIVGLPGYPVGSYQEGLLVYVNSTGVCFIHGRSTTPVPTALDINAVYHFTATRKTQEEIVLKNRDSCHYDDPDYDFEGWIENKLPHLKPGVKDCHMFKPWQIWPEIRNFTKEEWAEMPERLKQYLGEPK